jgi:hypothetical protein
MKLRNWAYLFVVVFSAGALTYLAMQWAITSYVKPTCSRYAESNGMTYVGYEPLDTRATVSCAHQMVRSRLLVLSRQVVQVMAPRCL